MKKTNFRNSIKKNVDRQQQQESNFGYLNIPKGVSLFQPKEGTMYLDFIPYEVTIDNHPDRDDDTAAKGTLWYRFPFKVHRNIGSDNDVVVCPSTFGKKCPICEHRKKRASEDADKDELKSLNVSKRNLYVLIPVGDKKMEEIPHIWDVSHYLFQKLLNEELQENEDNAIFPDIQDGLTLKVRFEETALGTNKFMEANRIDFQKRKIKYDDTILDEVPNLDKLLTVLSYAELKAKFLEIDPEDVSNDDVVEEQDEKPTRRIRSTEKEEPQTRSRKTNKPPVEEEDENDIPFYDDEADDGISIPIKERCVACGGTGTNSKGRRCPICNGTGRKPIEDVDTEEEQEEIKPKRETPQRTPQRESQKEKANKCPFGFKFGTDVNEHDECSDCDKWDACMDASE